MRYGGSMASHEFLSPCLKYLAEPCLSRMSLSDPVNLLWKRLVDCVWNAAYSLG